MPAPQSLAPLKVAMLSPCFWPEVRRGTERFIAELGHGLIDRGQAPALITSHLGPPTRAREDGLPVLRLPRPPQGRLLRRGYLPYLTHVPLSYLALRAGSFDLAHAMYPSDALAASRWRRRTGRPAVFSYMGIPDRPGLREHRRSLQVMRAALAGTDAVVALSHHAAAAFRYWLGEEALIIPPGVDLNQFTPLAERAPQPTVICSAAADVPRKHVGLLVQAFALVRQVLPNAQLILSRPREMAAARRAGVDAEAPGVHWVALDDRWALSRAYALAWVAALPATGEAFGLVLIEALACGTPIVAYADGALPEVLDRPGIGRLFDRLEPKPLAAALLEAIELSGQPATPAACRARAEEFSIDACVESYLRLYRTLT